MLTFTALLVFKQPPVAQQSEPDMNKYRMRSGFSLIRNGERLGYPYKEALLSLAPLVDELVVAHGDSTDNTGAELEALRPLLKCPLKIINSPWDPSSLKGGLELSRQTNIALDACSHDVCVYIQADEILHEDEYPTFMRDLARFEKDLSVDALAFQWIHFLGTYQPIIEYRRWYRRSSPPGGAPGHGSPGPPAALPGPVWSGSRRRSA